KKTLVKKVVGKEKLEAKLTKLLARRENEILRENPSSGKKISKIYKKMQHEEWMRKEIYQAIQVGDQASKLLKNIIQYLKRAKDWGQWDMANRRGRMTDYQKYSNMDRARNLTHQAQNVLLRFKSELKDVYQDVHFSFQMDFSNVTRFTDIFFDNIISDWIVQQRIVTALKNVSNVKLQVDQALKGLNSELPRIDKTIEQLEIEKEKLILESFSD
ncbi:MAG: hypothetical protein AAGK97_00940, partial [Bacteroidota bacterium]